MINTSNITTSNVVRHKKNRSGGATNITTKWTDTEKYSRHMSIDLGIRNKNKDSLQNE